MTAPPPQRGFERAEFEARAERLQAGMSKADIDLMLLTTEPDVRYLSGFDTPFWHSPTRPWFLLLPAAGPPVAVIPEIGAPAMSATWVTDIRTWPAPVPDDDGITLLREAIRELVGQRGSIGVPMGPETHLRMPLADWSRLRDLLPEVRVLDATPTVAAVRMIKSAAEVAKIRHICQRAGDAFDALPDLAREGVALSAVFRRFRIDLLRRGADDVPYLVGAAGPGGYPDVISPPTDDPLREGDVLMLDTGAVYDGYFCDFDRNVAIGQADDAACRAYDTLHRAIDAGLRTIRPGARCSDLFGAMAAVIEADGFDAGNVGRFGHGLGSQLTEWPSHTPTDHTALQPAMVVTLEPGLTIAPGRTMVHEEDVLVTPDGAELLTRRAPADLAII